MSHSSLIKVFKPKYYSLFPYLESYGINIEKAAGQLKLLMITKEPDLQAEIIDLINFSEREGERLKEATYTSLKRLIVLPFDREDIFYLVNKSNDLLDSFNKTGRVLKFNNHNGIIGTYAEISGLMEVAAVEISGCFKGLKDIGSNKQRMTEACNRLTKLNKEAEDVYFDGILNIYIKDNDMVQLTINKKLYESFMISIKRIKDITEAFRTILIKVM